MNPKVMKFLKETVRDKQPQGDGRDWARAILTRKRGGLSVPLAIREMAERALKQPKEEA